MVQDAAFWDKMAEDYETNAHPFTMLYAKAMLSRLPVGSGVRVLDVATGTGAAALPAAETGAEVVAIDFSERMVQRVRNHKVPNIDARRMDGQALQLPDASFDVAVSLFGVPHFPDWNKGLREMARVTKSGGTAAVVTWRDPEGTNIYEIIGKVARELFPNLIKLPPPPAGMVALSDPERLSAAMVAAGFEKPTIETLKEKYKFRVEQLFLANQWSRRLDAAQQKAIIDEVRHRFGHERDGDNLFVEPEALLAIAKRR
jgi:ubiquinone/menaquinone biosynthesis C-methylase UbiE